MKGSAKIICFVWRLLSLDTQAKAVGSARTARLLTAGLRLRCETAGAVVALLSTCCQGSLFIVFFVQLQFLCSQKINALQITTGALIPLKLLSRPDVFWNVTA
jgi:hypothetical protein